MIKDMIKDVKVDEEGDISYEEVRRLRRTP